MSMIETRIYWIDRMKVLGMLAIVWGHFFPNMCVSNVLYSFSVPLFFIISGFLSKEREIKIELERVCQSLVIPYSVLFILREFIYLLEGKQVVWLDQLGGFLLGFQSVHQECVIGPLWFVYTLAIVRIENSLIKKYNINPIMTFVVSLLLCFCYNRFCSQSYDSAIINTLLALPFFQIGVICKKEYNRWHNYRVNKYIYILSLLLLIDIWIINGAPMLYQCHYGVSLTMLFIGSLLSTYILYQLCTSELVERLCQINTIKSIVEYISKGNIVILAFHVFIIETIVSNFAVNTHDPFISFFFSLIIISVFIPIVYLINKFKVTRIVLLGAK